MRILFLVLTLFFILISIVFLILPLGTFAYVPIGLFLLFAILTLIKSKEEQKILPRWLIILSLVFLVIATTKVVFVKDVVEDDNDFEIEQAESTEEAKHELEEIEQLEDMETIQDLEAVDSIK